MNYNQNNAAKQKLFKLAAEDTALNGCRGDLSDVQFEIKYPAGTYKIILAAAAFFGFFGIRLILRRSVGNPDFKLSALDIGFFVLLGLMVMLAVVSIILSKKKSNVTVAGKSVFYNGNSWTSDEISCVKCSKFLEHISVYSAGKKIFSFPWTMENAEIFIAWTKKCGIVFEDNRMI